MYASRTILHLLISALLIVPAVCCGQALERVPEAQPVSVSEDCPGHAQRGDHLSRQDGCAGCALAEAALNSPGTAADDEAGSAQPELPAGGLLDVPRAASADPRPAVPIPRSDALGLLDTPVTRFDRLLLPS